MQDTEKSGRELKSARGLREMSCIVIGGGQAGAMLSLLLSQKDVRVSRLESYEELREVNPGVVHPAVTEILEHLGFAERDPKSAHRELPLTLPTLLVVPAMPAAFEEDQGTKDGESQFELGRARGRIELLEQEIRRREKEIAGLRNPH